MAGKQKRLREKLFDYYSKHLAAAKQVWPDLPALPDHFICPLCRHPFDRTALNEPVQLTVEHSIPVAIGGTNANATLTCARCNNDSGSSLDVHLKNRFDAEEFLQGISDTPVRATLNVGGYEAAVEWLHRGGAEGKNEIRIKEKATKKGNPEAIQEEFMKRQKNWQGFRFQINVPMRFKAWRVHVGLLRLAFLQAFMQFGYAFALNSSVDTVLNQIQNPATRLLPDAFCVDLSTLPFSGNRILFVKQPEALRSTLVMLELKTDKRTIRKGVILPHPGDSASEIYRRLEEHKKQSDTFAPVCDRITQDPIDLTNPDYVTAFFEIWEDLPWVETT